MISGMLGHYEGVSHFGSSRSIWPGVKGFYHSHDPKSHSMVNQTSLTGIPRLKPMSEAGHGVGFREMLFAGWSAGGLHSGFMGFIFWIGILARSLGKATCYALASGFADFTGHFPQPDAKNFEVHSNRIQSIDNEDAFPANPGFPLGRMRTGLIGENSRSDCVAEIRNLTDYKSFCSLSRMALESP